MMVAAVDIIYDCINQVRALSNAANQEWCRVVHGVTLIYERHPLVPSFVCLSCSVCYIWTLHTYISPVFLHSHAFYKHLLSTYYEQEAQLELGMWRLIGSGDVSHGDLFFLGDTMVRGRSIQTHLSQQLQLQWEELVVQAWTNYLASLSLFCLLCKM